MHEYMEAWNTTTSGPLLGEQLETIIYCDYFASWLVFYPDTRIYE